MTKFVYSCSLAIILLACLAAAQQQPTPAPTPPTTTTQAPVPANICNVTNTKPTPAVNLYYFDSCVVAKFSAYIALGKDQYIDFAATPYNVSGNCGNPPTNATATQNKIIINYPCAQLAFDIGRTGENVYVNAIDGFYTVDQTGPKRFTNFTELFKTTLSGHSYKCDSEQTIPLNITAAELKISNFIYEAFRNKSGSDLYQIPQVCELDSSQVSDLVRIGVGVSLVLLVAIVLVAYFVGRRRWAERSSYESV